VICLVSWAELRAVWISHTWGRCHWILMCVSIVQCCKLGGRWHLFVAQWQVRMGRLFIVLVNITKSTSLVYRSIWLSRSTGMDYGMLKVLRSCEGCRRVFREEVTRICILCSWTWTPADSQGGNSWGELYHWLGRMPLATKQSCRKCVY